MPLHSIPPHALSNGLLASPEQAERWCAYLESGMILYFPRSPLPVPRTDIEFLLNRKPAGGKFHEDIFYDPYRDRLRGADRNASSSEEIERLRLIMHRFSANAVRLLSGFLTPYERGWRIDYASFKANGEAGHTRSQPRRNDLLQIDAFPARPARGWRILRFFANIHPAKTCDWMTGEPFPRILGAFWPTILATPRGEGRAIRAARRFAESTGLTSLAPWLKRTPYDRFMLELHDAMKHDAQFQRTCPKETLQFAPGSCWMIYTDTVPYAIRAGQYTLEQTLFVDPAANVTHGSAPLTLLEEIAGAKLGSASTTKARNT
ncbi:MAG: Kdo hydroxylase family protein [Acidobacteriota bacterium]